MSRELAYLLLICGLLVVPGLLLRLRIPPPLTCFMLGIAVILALPEGHHSDAAVHLLAALGISTLFLYAGLEVNLETLRQAAGPLSIYLLTLVLAAILRERGAISDELFGGLLLYAGLNTLLPSFVLRTAFDVAPTPGAQ